MKVVITQPVFDETVEGLRRAGLDVVDLASNVPLSADDIVSAGAGADALMTHLTDRVDASVFARSPTLRVVANVAAGFDNIDISAARRAGVCVTNTPDVLTNATADLAMALVLAVARRIPECDHMVRTGGYHGWRFIQEPMGFDVSGAVMGIVGLGRIGLAVAKRAYSGFDMSVVYAHPREVPEANERFGATRMSLEQVLEVSDVVSLHAPLTPATHHLINAAALKRMKPSAILVNTARGPLVDEAALASALLNGVIAGAALDVYEREPEVERALISLRERVVLAPHVGSATITTRRRMAAVAAANIIAVLEGTTPPNVVA